ncbi:SGNH/GDSL hydrolase family protein [Nocardia asteroides]|uniref:SGNH/GDSL hydrolase family protein n=1 Tax=Nocardia asteroides TaxID=1824 RepID=UPI0022B83654|nr:SGNH/GDSL hydrolase family protein [Nocardia asteroides]
MQCYTRFVAIGDSQTEGVGDPDESGGLRGWADRFADMLGGEAPEFRYANLAIRGRRAGQIRAEQLAPALAMQPDLTAVLAGLNDLIRPRFDREALLAELAALIEPLRTAGSTVVTFTFPDIGAIAPVLRPLAGRIRQFNADVRELAVRYEAVLVELEPVPVAAHRLLWAQDRLHLSPLGHEVVARAAAEALRVPGADGSWREPLPPVRQRGGEQIVDELRWATVHMLPWLVRRARGISTGDRVTAKRPQLAPLFEG